MDTDKKRSLWFFAAVSVLALATLWFMLKPACLLAKDAADTLLRSWGALPGIGYNLLRSLQMLGLVMVFIVPISFGMALWMYVYASKKALGRVRSWLGTFAMLPAVILGLLGRMLLTPYFGSGMASMVIVMCLFIAPSLTVSFEQAFQTVPESKLNAGIILGASKIAVVWKIVIPGVFWKLMRCCVKCVERILGEATALLVLLGAVPTGSVLSVELYRLTWIGRQDAALLAFCLGLMLVVLRIATSKRWGEETDRAMAQTIWQRD